MPNLQEKIQNLRKQGKKNPDIIDQLKKEGNSAQEIYDAMNNSQEKNPDSELRPPTPSQEMGSEKGFEDQEEEGNEEEDPSQQFMSNEKFPAPKNITGRQQIEEIEEIAESIINEKMDELSINFGEFSLWKEKASTEIEAIKQEVLRVRNQVENLQSAMVGKVEDYRKNISDLGVEVKALSKVLEKILEPLSNNVKELSRITEKIKK